MTNVALEYAPDRSLHLKDGTAFDAIAEYTLAGGGRGFVGIETKLTEPFGSERYAFAPGYSRWITTPGWWWREGAERHFPDPHFNQLWRNHLLAFAIFHQGDAAYAEAYSAVLYHDEDTSCVEAIRQYGQHLRPEAVHTLLDWPLTRVVDAWAENVETRDEKSWLAAFRLRYLDLEASQPAWETFQQEAAR